MSKKNNTQEETIETPQEEILDETAKELTDKELLEQKVEELEQKNKELETDFLRARADFENLKKRSQEELIAARQQGVKRFVENLLPSIDNFEMSLKMTDNTEMFVRGVEMIHQNLLETLEQHKITIFEPKIGSQFNPIEHEPVLVEDPNKEPGTIIAVLQKGYKLDEKILRAAKVQVVKEKEE